MRILVIDDDSELCSLLDEFLTREGYEVDFENEGRRGLERALKGEHDLIVLDVMLPGMDGFEILRRLRPHSQIPVIMLTARGEDVDRIIGLEIGADDYLPKPFNPRELLVRIRAVLRRAANTPRDPNPQLVRGFSFGGWKLDTTRRVLTDASGKEVSLSGAEYRLLAVLLSAGNRVLSRAQLTELLRGREADPFDRSIDVRVSRLRQILGDDARAPQIIKTVYGEGYVIGVPVESS